MVEDTLVTSLLETIRKQATIIDRLEEEKKKLQEELLAFADYDGPLLNETSSVSRSTST